MSVKLWEILVPTVKRRPNGTDPYYKTRYHRVWDAKVEKIGGGLTILRAVKGRWKSLENELFEERMIPVRFMAADEQAREIALMTMEYYDQLAVMCYEVSNNVIMVHKDDAND
jgi:hypothetical protein